MKRFTCLALALCLFLTAPMALAQEQIGGARPMIGISIVHKEEYVPGEQAKSLIKDALKQGNVLIGDVHMDIDMDPETVARQSEPNMDEEELAKYIQKLTTAEQLLNRLVQSVGIGVLENGVRLVLDLSVREGEKSAGFDVALNVTTDGLSIESNLMPGQRLVASWQELYSIFDFLIETPALSDIDWDAAVDAISTQVLDIIKQAVAWAGPYIHILADDAQDWSVSVKKDVPAQGYYPAVDEQVNVTITSGNLAKLFSDIAAQFDQDPEFDALALSLGFENVYDLREEIAAGLQDIVGWFESKDMIGALVLGYSDESAYLVGELDVNGTPEVVGSLTLDGEDPYALSVDLFGVEDDVIADQLSLSFLYSEEGETKDCEVQFVSGKDGEQHIEYHLTNTGAPETSEEGQMAWRDTTDAEMTVTTSDELYAKMHGEGLSALTVGGGENYRGDMNIDVTLDGQTISVPVNGSWWIEPAGEGVEGEYEILADFSALGTGLQSFGFSGGLHTENYNPATINGLEPINMAHGTEEEFNELYYSVELGLITQTMRILNLLPEDMFSDLVKDVLNRFEY